MATGLRDEPTALAVGEVLIRLTNRATGYGRRRPYGAALVFQHADAARAVQPHAVESAPGDSSPPGA
jgi:hypothetical protein